MQYEEFEAGSAEVSVCVLCFVFFFAVIFFSHISLFAETCGVFQTRVYRCSARRKFAPRSIQTTIDKDSSLLAWVWAVRCPRSTVVGRSFNRRELEQFSPLPTVAV